MGLEDKMSTKHPRQGKRVRTLDQLYQLAIDRRSVFSPLGGGFLATPRRAAVIINQQGFVLRRLFHGGMYVYNKPTAKKKGG